MSQMRYLLILFSCLFTTFATAHQSPSDTIFIRFQGRHVRLTPRHANDLQVKRSGAALHIQQYGSRQPHTFVLSGQSDAGRLVYRGRATATFCLQDLNLHSPKGAAIDLRGEHTYILEMEAGTENHLQGEADSTHRGTLYCRGNLKLQGHGSLDIISQADGLRGIYVRGDLDISDLKLDVQTTGNPMSQDTMQMMPPPPFDFQGDNEDFADEGFPPEDMMMPPPGGPGEYRGTAKGIKCIGIIDIHSGIVNVSTQTAGAEGIEGKDGIIIRDAQVHVEAQDDGLNSNGPILFNGGQSYIFSKGNDAVDSNSQNEGAISLNGGDVTALSAPGPPEEGLDCDFSPLILTGGTIFTLGGAMGEWPSTPSEDTADQPWSVQTGIQVHQGETLQVVNPDGEILHEQVIPFETWMGTSFFSLTTMKPDVNYSIRVVKK